jgi:4-amino-4-deoxy-L-arabinose transferase-like glycosyltransferase
MWTEEEYVLSIVKLPIMGVITNFDYTPPVYNILAYISYTICGGYDVAIRFPALIAGIMLIPLMYYLGKEYYSELAGIYCAGLSAILLPLIYYSQFGRAYSLSLLFFVVALILYLKMKNGDNHLDIRVVFWVMIVLNLYTHLFTIIPLGLMCIDLLLFDKKNWWSAIITGIASLPLVSVLVSVLSTRTHDMFNYGASPLQMAFLTLPEFFNTIFLNVVALACVGIWLYSNKISKRLVVITIVTLIVGVVGATITPMFPRYLMSAAVVILLFCSVGITELTTILNRKTGMDLTYVVMTGIFVVFIWMMLPNLESHYFVQQYV